MKKEGAEPSYTLVVTQCNNTIIELLYSTALYFGGSFVTRKNTVLNQVDRLKNKHFELISQPIFIKLVSMES